MFEHRKIAALDDFFRELSDRRERAVYFYRINGFNRQIEEFVSKYYNEARLSGVVIEGKIPNPDEKNLAYYNEIMGGGFEMSKQFICTSLRKWLPRMNAVQNEAVGGSLYSSLEGMRRNGKNDNMLKNAYTKFMCWLYYKFERIVGRLGDSRIPKILYEGDISNYELMMISILSGAGCDVVLLQYHGDVAYLKADPSGKLSDRLDMPDMTGFPDGYSLKTLREKQKAQAENERLYGAKASLINCTNAWITGKGFEDILKPAAARGSDPKLFYNCFYRINGAEDRLTYQNELYSLYQELKSSGRRTVVINAPIEPPAVEEINGIRRKNYADFRQAMADLSSANITASSEELRRLTVKAFTDVMLEQTEREGMNLNKLVNKAVYLLCWFKRYQKQLFSGWKQPEIGCLIYFGACRSENEALFLKMMSRLPTDVLALNPDLNAGCVLEDKMLYEISFAQSAALKEFPQSGAGMSVGTAAYHAERELDTIMYTDSGLYRNQQYGKAQAVRLRTMYEEIEILWDQELKYRPNFGTTADTVNIPVIFAKVSGVKDGDVGVYWSSVKRLITDNTLVIKKAPYIRDGEPNPIRTYATEFYRNGKLQREKIKAHSSYRYGLLREEMQEHILDKLQTLIDSKMIKGTFENGMEYTIVSVALNLNKEIVRMLQKFDFTKKNPKILYINTTEEIISTEDSILTAFLSLLGFDVVFFVPTGYRNVENHFNGTVMEEHQAGEYVYDLSVPDFSRVSSATVRQSWRDKIFKRGQ